MQTFKAARKNVIGDNITSLRVTSLEPNLIIKERRNNQYALKDIFRSGAIVLISFILFSLSYIISS